MVLYFSGTGNSRYTAQIVGAVTDDKTISINALLKSGREEVLQSDKPFVFVCPTYAWRIPRIVDAFIRRTRFTGSNEAYFILTCGGEPGNAAQYAQKTCSDKGFAFLGLGSVVMPENYIAIFDVPEKTQADALLQKAIPRIRDIAGYIKAGQPLPHEKVTFIDRHKSGIVNVAFYSFFVKAKGFHSTDACISCGKCVELCPLNNIKLSEGRPQWGQNCTHCMACICGCPSEAIEYKNHTKGKTRYFNTDAPPV